MRAALEGYIRKLVVDKIVLTVIPDSFCLEVVAESELDHTLGTEAEFTDKAETAA